MFALLVSTTTFASSDFLIKTKNNLSQRDIIEFQMQKVRDQVFVVPAEQLAAVREKWDIVAINPNHKIELDGLPDDLNSDQWGIKNNNPGIDANIVSAWLTTTGSKNIVVAVTDSGVDIQHPDLKENLWQNQAEIQGKAGVDDDGNGHIDDFHGWNVALDNNDLTDVKRHGTHVAGIIGARGNNGKGLVGVNWQVSLMPVAFFHKNKDTKVADAIRAIDYAVENGAHIINASWGAAADDEPEQEFSLLGEAVQRAADANVIFVAAAGNSGYDNDNKGHVPASLLNDNIVSVGAVTRNGWPPSFSNFGQDSVDVFAPGSVIKSTLPGGYYGNLNGTSMAAPFVSGILALLLSVEPDLKVAQMTRRLIDSCQANSNLTKLCVCQGHIDAEKVLNP